MKHFADLSPAAERIVDAAQELVQHLGFNGFSYEDIAQRVGIRKPSIHHHFPTKVELVVVLTQRYIHRIDEQLKAIEAGHDSAIERLRAYAEIFARTYAQDRRLCMCGMLGAEADSLPEDIRTEVQRFFDHHRIWLARVIAAGQAAGQLRRGQTPANLAALWLSAMEGSLVMGRGATDAPSPAMIAGSLIDTWRA